MEETNTVTALPFRLLSTDILRRNPGAPDAVVVHYEQFYFNPTLYVAVYSRVGLFPLCREAAGYAFKRSLSLHLEETSHRDAKWGEVEMMPDACSEKLHLQS